MFDDLYNEQLVDSPDEIERVIEGGEDNNQYESGRESNKEEEKNEEEGKEKDEVTDKKTKVRRKLGPRVVLNADRLNGPRGIGTIESFFSDIKLHGKGREQEDLELVMKRLEHWAHRLAPRMQFDDCLKKIEKLGSKKLTSNRVKRIRLGMDDDAIVRDEEDNDVPESPPPIAADDAFDQLMSSSVPAAPVSVEMTAEQREQMLRNRLIAEERRTARIKKAQEMKQKFQEKLLNSQSQTSHTDVTSEDQSLKTVEENDKDELPAVNDFPNSQEVFEDETAEFEKNVADFELEINENLLEKVIEKKGSKTSIYDETVESNIQAIDKNRLFIFKKTDEPQSLKDISLSDEDKQDPFLEKSKHHIDELKKNCSPEKSSIIEDHLNEKVERMEVDG